MEGLAAVLRVKVGDNFHNITIIKNKAGKRLFLKVPFVTASLVAAFIRTVTWTSVPWWKALEGIHSKEDWNKYSKPGIFFLHQKYLLTKQMNWRYIFHCRNILRNGLSLWHLFPTYTMMNSDHTQFQGTAVVCHRGEEVLTQFETLPSPQSVKQFSNTQNKLHSY